MFVVLKCDCYVIQFTYDHLYPISLTSFYIFFVNKQSKITTDFSHIKLKLNVI